MTKAYNIKFKPHHRTSLWLDQIPANVVYANNKASAKELGQAIVRGYYEAKGEPDPEYYEKQYTYTITAEEV